MEVVQGEAKIPPNHLGCRPCCAMYPSTHSHSAQLSAGWEWTPYTACAWRGCAPVVSRTRTWHHRLERNSSIAVSPSGAFAQSFTCRAGSPWRTRMPSRGGGASCPEAAPALVGAFPPGEGGWRSMIYHRHGPPGGGGANWVPPPAITPRPLT